MPPSFSVPLWFSIQPLEQFAQTEWKIAALCTPATEFAARGCSPERHGRTRALKTMAMGQVEPKACFYKARKLQRVLIFSMIRKSQKKKQYFVSYGKYRKFKF